MADPLSIAASIAGVIGLADIVFIRTRKYLSSAKNADKDVKDLSQEVLLLSGALHSLSRLAQALDQDGLRDQHIDSLRMHHIAACHATLDEIAKKLKKLEDSTVKRKVVWPFMSGRTEELLAEISRHKENVDLALTADSMGTLLRVLSRTEEIKCNTEEVLQDVRKTREIVVRIHQDSERRGIINYFLPYNPQQNYEMSLSLRYPRTGLWLTRRPELQTWLQSTDSALWLSGIPGAGKTVLAGTVIEEALKKSSEDVATTFFFCDYKETLTQKPENVLSALASQLAIQKEEGYACLARYYKELHPSRGLDRCPEICGLRKTLKDMVKCFDHVYLIVDGLDECGNNTDMIIDSILDIVECSDNMSTALLSRDEYNIRDRLASDFTGLEIAAHTEDITEYVTSEMEKRISNKTLRIDNLSLKGDILERLIGGAKGMFRWVACQLDFLGDCLSDKECRDALDRLPPGLNESYQRILQRVPTGKERVVQMILNFIAYAEPRLDTRLLREIVSVPEKVNENDILDPQSTIREESIGRLCGSLVRKSNDGCRYEFAHFSVQEFLEGEMASMHELQAFQVSKGICQLLLAKQCLNYLEFKEFSYLPQDPPELQDSLKSRMGKYPFYLYAAVCWPLFARAHWADETLIELAKTLFQQQKTGNFISWALELASFVKFRRIQPIHTALGMLRHNGAHGEYISGALHLLPKLLDRRFTTLHMASALSLPAICSSLIGREGALDQRSSFGSPLQCAVQGMFLANVDMITNDAFNLSYYAWDPDSEGNDDASGFGTQQTIGLLLQSGASRISVCSYPFEGQSLVTAAFKVAVHVGDLSAIASLVEAGYDLNDHNLDQFSKLNDSWSQNGRWRSSDVHGLKSLALSLSPVIDTSAINFSLCQAVWSTAVRKDYEFARNPDIVDTRISLSEDSLAERILHSVLNRDIPALIKTLKDPRAKVKNMHGSGHRTPFGLWFASLKKFETRDALTVIRALLCAGMDVNQPNEWGLLPIHELATANWAGEDDIVFCEIVREFIRRGASCGASTRKGQNVFHLGLRSPGFINAVLQSETEENILKALQTRDEQKYTPIALALRVGHEEVALLLLEATNLNPKTVYGPTSVYADCVAAGARRAFDLLLSIKAQLDPAGTAERTLFHHVSPRTGKAFVSELLSIFPNGLHHHKDGRTPLNSYLQNCIGSGQIILSENVVRLLAAPGSDGLEKEETRVTWNNFILYTRTIQQPRDHWESERLMDGTKKALCCLLKLGFIDSYEAGGKVSASLPMLKHLRNSLDDLWPFTSSDIRSVLEHTTLWEFLRVSPAIFRLLKAAIRAVSVDLVSLLLKNGVSAHHRIGDESALELACLRPAGSPAARHIFTLLLEHAQASLINEINAHEGQERGLIHYLVGDEKQWQLEQLLKQGVDVNLCTNIYGTAQPAVVHHLWEDSSESAMMLLENGADPMIADNRGMDTALAAATKGKLDVLLHLYTSSQGQVNWRKTCQFTDESRGGRDFSVSGASALHLAANNGHCDILGFYLDNHLLTNMDTVSDEFITPIHLASFHGRIDVVRFLHSRGADINLKSADGSLPLHLAVQEASVEVVKFLLENGSAMDADVRGLTPVGYALRQQNTAILDCLRTANQYSDYQFSPGKREQEFVLAYEQALVRGDVNECEQLRQRGCPVNADLPSQKGRSVLVVAIQNSRKKVIKWLLDHDAKVTCRTFDRNFALHSPLHAMISRPALSNLLPLLLQKYDNEGGSITQEEPSLVCGAIVFGNNVGLKLLLEHVAKHDFPEYCIEELRRPGFSPSPVDRHRLNDEGPLHLAVRRGNCEAVKLLLDHGADADALDSEQRTALQTAIQFEPSVMSPATRLLLPHAARLENRDNRGQTAVLSASVSGRTGIVRLLDEAGADLQAVDFDSWNCLHYAANFGHTELFAWLVQRGLHVHANTSQGWSAMQYASFKPIFSSFLLNFVSAFDISEKVVYRSPGYSMNAGPAWLNGHFHMYLRRLGRKRFHAWANLKPTDSWTPLCIMASIGQTLAVTNTLRLGAAVDYEGSPHGSALMAACSSGRLESVKILVRYGATLSYQGPSGSRSAIDIARRHKDIVAWLLVGRFIEQRKISNAADAAPSTHAADIVNARSGIVKAELVITGTAERQVHESARDYWIRLMAVKKEWRGRVVRQHKMVQTHRSSRLIPEEPVRICPGHYGVPEESK